MNTSRRKFTKDSLILGLGLPLLGKTLVSCNPEAENESSTQISSPSPLSILILGGTSFLGPNQIAYALSRGHTVTTFTRGRTEPTIHKELFSGVESLIGDRENDLTALENRDWDVVIDNSGHNAEWTKRSAELLKDRVELYLYTSSTGVYYPYLGDNIDEDTSLLTVEPEGIEDEEMKMEYWYGVMKTNSEMEARKAFGDDRSIIVRPTYMIGPGDLSDRFVYWPIRLSRGGDVLVPGKSADPVQYVDVRDVAEWMIRLAESQTAGTFNAVGPSQAQTIIEFVNEAASAFDIESSLVTVDDYEFLLANGIPYLVPWIMPEGNNYGSSRINFEKGIGAGLTFRPLIDSVRDTHDWWYSDALTQERRDAFEKKDSSVLVREAEILEKWKNR